MLSLTQTPSVLWYFARAGGFVSLLLLSATVCAGVAMSLRWRSPRWPAFVTEGLHRYLSTVMLVFISIHVMTLLLDPFAKFSVQDVLVPLASSYRTFWMGLGICAAELTVAFALSVHLRKAIGYRLWRLVHYGTYGLFPLALLHGLGTGTDTRTGWGLALYLLAGVPVLALVLMRAFPEGSETSPSAAPAAARPTMSWQERSGRGAGSR
ncbi:MAG: ferric reductase-like transmembrane domain-containing protein [Candidatus Dormibacteria bacterium]